jgi:hypothetical protein
VNFNGGTPKLYFRSLVSYSIRSLKRKVLKSKTISLSFKLLEKFIFRPASKVLLKSGSDRQIIKASFWAYSHHQADYEESKIQEIKFPNQNLVFALYLPQFQPLQINDRIWGEGFTEWTNVATSRPLFHGHEQPIIPGKLGFYDLRNRETIREQIKMAKNAGLTGFIVMIYWFEDHSVMAESLKDIAEVCSEEEFYFIFEWANEPWTMKWDGLDKNVIENQPKNFSLQSAWKLTANISDFLKHPFYFKTEGRPVFFVYNPGYFENDAVKILRDAFSEFKLDVYMIGMQTFGLNSPSILKLGYDETAEYFPHNMTSYTVPAHRKLLPATLDVSIESYPDSVRNVTNSMIRSGIPSCFPSWDNSPRRKYQGSNVFVDCSSEFFAVWFEDCINRSLDRSKSGSLNMVIVNAWNEWGEGAVLEPSRNSGYAYLNALNRVLKQYEY